MRLLGWRLINQVPTLDKYLVIAAPHTTNWDFFYMLLMRGASGVNFHWVGKDALFRFPMGGVMRWLGGIPVNRRIRANFVDQIVELFKQHKQLVLAIAPEGTRGRSVTWRNTSTGVPSVGASSWRPRSDAMLAVAVGKPRLTPVNWLTIQGSRRCVTRVTFIQKFSAFFRPM